MIQEYSGIFLKVILVFKTIMKSQFWDLKTGFWMFQVHILDLNASNASELFHILDLNASNASKLFHILDLNAPNASELFHIIGPQCLQCLRAIPYFGPRGTATTAAAATAAAAAAVSQELWNLGGALVQRAQEQNIPCGESLTSIS